MTASMNNSTTQFSNMKLDLPHYLLIGVCLLIILVFIVLGTLWLKKYRSLERTIRDLRGGRPLGNVLSTPDSPVLSPASLSPHPVTLTEKLGQEDPEEQTSLQRNKNRSVTNRLLWRPPQQGPRFTKSDLSLLQLIKAGKEGVFYKARMTRGTCKGHGMFTCKITKEGVTPKRMEMEVSIMRKLVHHKNVLQLLDWNTTEEPYVLIMEFVSNGTLRSFLQTHRDKLISDPELQSLFTIASYHIALAMEHLRSKMVVHCDLALRNIMVSRFPWEVKVSEFGLARDLTRMKSRRSSRRKHPRERVPLRWYPPEYFRINYYSFKGDVWAFGIVLWEIQTFGTLPYHDLETPEAVVYHICAGHKNKDPEGCRPEILQIMRDCWMEPYTSRPSFSDIVRILEDIMENDSDYVDVENSRLLATRETDNHDSKSINHF
ncbi:fibroblast growth factor receptor homolog 1 [Salmo salar]|uniref:Fibroblast growth factor receptor homolog 1 n=1 Tax=Salmo salar TaxID=8030 RepID=A0A1S3NUL1_SALSA|nr:fibroblast growth factor receptor homolog 1 [Salmo salar]|eukprot:XP_014019092.1 PREDICTED: fibroblast growth factor receptor homolog 1-like [Salmo salar]